MSRNEENNEKDCTVITAEFTLNGQKFLGLDGGPYFHFNEAISMTIECEYEENNN